MTMTLRRERKEKGKVRKRNGAHTERKNITDRESW